MVSADKEEECSRQLEQQHGNFIGRVVSWFELCGTNMSPRWAERRLLDWRCRPLWCTCLWSRLEAWTEAMDAAECI